MPEERYSKENTEVETKRSSLRKTECPRLSRRNQVMGAKVLFGPPAEEPIKRQPKLSNGHGPMDDEESPDAKDHGPSSVYLQCIRSPWDPCGYLQGGVQNKATEKSLKQFVLRSATLLSNNSLRILVFLPLDGRQLAPSPTASN